MDPDLHVDPDPRWIRIHVIPILALVDVIPDPDPDPAKNGIVTPLIINHQHSAKPTQKAIQRARLGCGSGAVWHSNRPTP